MDATEPTGNCSRGDFEAEVIVLCVRWYLRFGLSFRNLEEMMAERNLTGRPRHHLALGAALRAGIEPPVPPGIAPRRMGLGG